MRKAGDPIHHMRIRVTVDTQLVVQAIEASLEAHPVQGCPGALAGMQRMVGCSMARGWRKAIDTQLAGIAGCTWSMPSVNRHGSQSMPVLPWNSWTAEWWSCPRVCIASW